MEQVSFFNKKIDETQENGNSYTETNATKEERERK